jgi:predicted permease
MSMRHLLRRIWHLVRQRQLEADLTDEMDFHRAMKQRELEDAGMPSEQSGSAARRALGSVALTHNQARDVWVPYWLQGLGQDGRLAVRSLRATPIVSTVAILSLALGVGANTAIFSLVNSLLLRPLPVKNPSQLVLVTDGTAPGIRQYGPAVWDQLKQRPQLFDSVAGWAFTRFNLGSGGGVTEFVTGLWASGSFFETLGVPALLGRALTDADNQHGGPDGPVAMISYGVWQQRFGGAADVIGRTLVLDGLPFSIVGVTPAAFFGPEVGYTFDVVVPVGDEPLMPGRQTNPCRENFLLTLMARLQSGQTVGEATRGLRSVQPQIRDASLPDGACGPPHVLDRYLQEAFSLVPAATGSSYLRRRFEQPLLAIMVVVAFVLLIACTNLASLLLARAAARQHELSLRVALGGSRWRLMRQLLTESLVLAGLGSACGLPVAWWGSQLLVRQLSTRAYPVFLDLSTDWRVVAFMISMTVTTALLFGATPALKASAVAPMDALKTQARGGSNQARVGLSNTSIPVQVALSVALVVAAGMFLRTYASLANRPLGFDREHVLLVSISTQRTTLPPTQRVSVYKRVREAVQSLPCVAEATLSLVTPVSGDAFVPPPPGIEVSGARQAPYSERISFGNVIAPGWFRTFGTPLVAGRDFTDRDRKGAPLVAVVNQTFANTFLNGVSPLGHTINLAPNAPVQGPPIEIVGVAADAVYRSLRDPVPPTFYLPLAQHDGDPAFIAPLASIRLSVRAKGGVPMLLMKSIAGAVGAVNPDLALTFQPLAEQVDASLTQERLVATLSGFFGTLALLLAGLGLYGVTSYAVSRRRGEIGIRMALGAARADVVRLVMSRVVMLVAIGVIAGTTLSLWASRYVASLLYGLQPRDPMTLLGAIAVLTTVATVAAGLPAWRASRIDPAVVLREA